MLHLEKEKANQSAKGLSKRNGIFQYIATYYVALNNGKSIFNENQSQEKLEESVDTFSICTSSSTSVLDTSADSSFDKEQRKISAHATLQVVHDQVLMPPSRLLMIKCPLYAIAVDT